MIGRVRTSPQTTQSITIPAPIAGITAIDPLVGMGQESCLFAKNVVFKDHGAVVRKGYEGVSDGMSSVKTIIPFHGEVASNNKLFAADEDGIWDATAGGTLASEELTWGSSAGDAGVCNFQHFRTSAGNFLAVCDEENGYVYYTESTDTWEDTPTINNVSAEDLVYVAVWKNRLVFAERDTGTIWYLPVGQISGDATAFYVGAKFKHGGNVAAIFNWTLDGGSGIDDFLVIVSTTGDVVVYQGYDPSDSSAFSQVGGWFAGEPPLGRRFGSDLGGDLVLMTAYGVIQASGIVSGQDILSNPNNLGRRINPAIREEFDLKSDTFGWQLTLHPTEGILIVTTPASTTEYTHYVYSLLTRAWSIWDKLPMQCSGIWQKELYFGTADGEIHKLSGHTDGADEDPIDFSILTSFQEYGAPVYKRAHFIEPLFIASGSISYAVEAKYDYDLGLIQGFLASAGSGGALWDSAVWGSDAWAGLSGVATVPQGASGMGKSVAVGVKGRTATKTTFLGARLMFDAGGLL